MMGLVEQIFGDLGLPARFIIAFVIVLILIGLTAWIIRRIAGSRSGIGGGRARQQRLGVIDAAQVDAKRRLVLVRRDNAEHLLLIGGPSDVVVESQIIRGQAPAEPQERRPQPRMEPPPPAAPQRRAPPVSEEPPVPPRPARPVQPAQSAPPPQPAPPQPAPPPQSEFPPYEPPQQPAPPQPAPPPQSPPPQSRTVPPPHFPQAGGGSLPHPAPEPRIAPAPAPPPRQSYGQGQSEAHLHDMAQRLESALVRPAPSARPPAEAEERSPETHPEPPGPPARDHFDEDRKRDS